MYFFEACNAKIIQRAIARKFLSSLYLPTVPSSTLGRISRAVTALIPHAYPPCHDCQCVFPCVLFSFTRWLNSCPGKSQARIRGKRLLSSPAQCRSLYPNSFDVRLFPPPHSRPLCNMNSLCSFRADFFVQHLITDLPIRGDNDGLMLGPLQTPFPFRPAPGDERFRRGSWESLGEFLT